MDLLPKRDLRHPLLRIEHLSKSFGAHEVLRDIDFTVYRGDVISVIGSSGSGKSTLLRCVNLLETPSSGEIPFPQLQYPVPRHQRTRLPGQGGHGLSELQPV